MAQHASLLKQLLPASYDTGSRVLSALLQAEGNALDAAVLLSDQLLAEDDPRTAMQLIPDWERVLGNSANADTASRRAFLVGKLNEVGGQSKQYFIDLAKSLGFVITIDEFGPANVLADVMAPMYTSEWYFVWRINAAVNANYRQATVMDTVMDAFASWGNADFEAAMREDAPAHTQVLFAYN